MISIDLETRSVLDLKKTGVYPYAAHPMTDVWCLAWCMAGDTEVGLWQPGDAVPEVFLRSEHPLRAWNANFERQIWNHILVPRYGFPLMPLHMWHCTMAEALAMGLPGKLEDAALALGTAQQKDKKGHALMMRMAKPRKIQADGTPTWWDDPGRRAQLAEYCRQDVRTEMSIGERLVPLADNERRVWLLDQRINDRGVGLDVELVKALLDIDNAANASADFRMAELTEGRVTAVTQVGQTKEWLAERGIDVEGLAKDDVRGLLEEDLPEDVQNVLLLRQEAGGTSSRKLTAMRNSVGRGNRIRGMLAYHGASTGRWAGRLVQPQNMPRGTIKPKVLEGCIDLILARDTYALDLLLGSIHAVVPSALRACFKAERGNALFVSDYSQIEARVIAWLAGAEHVLDVFRRGEDIYQATADRMGVDRQVGKVAVLALGFQGGKGAFQNMAKVYGLKVTDEQADKYKVDWREANPEIVSMWGEIETASRKAVEQPGSVQSCCAGRVEFRCHPRRAWLRCYLPSGRVLWYANPHLAERKTPWGSTRAELRAWGVDSYTRKWASYSAYGGLLTENIVQAVARDMMAHAMLALDEKGYSPILTVHDEVVTETREDFGSVSEFTEIMTTIPAWADGLPVKAESYKATRYKK